MASASPIRFAGLLVRSVTEEDFIDEAIELLLARKALRHPPPESDESGPLGIGQRTQVGGVYLRMTAELPEVSVHDR